MGCFPPSAPFGAIMAEKAKKGIRGPDTPPVKPSAWPAQPAGLTPRRRASPPPQRHPAPCLAAERGALTARRPWAVACPSGAPLTTKMGTGHSASHPHFCLPACGGSYLVIHIIYKVGWVAYRTIFRARGLEVKIPRQGPKDTPAGTHLHVFPPPWGGKRSPCLKNPLSPPAQGWS